MVSRVEYLGFFVGTLLCSLAGLRLASYYRIFSLTGLILAAGCCIVIETELWRLAVHWAITRSTHLHTLSFGELLVFFLSGILLLATVALALFQKYKVLAYMKLTGLCFSMSVVAVGVPKYGPAVIEKMDAPAQPGLALVDNDIDLLKSLKAGSSKRVLGLVDDDCPLYRRSEHRMQESSLTVPKGTWVLVRAITRDTREQQWAEVMLPHRDGKYVDKVSPTGFIPRSKLGEMRDEK